MARCPGQDQRFWKPEDIFEVECPACGSSVEFWKDEPQVKCPSCKEVITNPKLDLGCAKWCKYAEECLGQIAGQGSPTLSNQLIECLRTIAGSDQEVIRLSLEILSYAEKIQQEEGGEPLVVKASVLLSQIHEQLVQIESEKDADDEQDLLIHTVLDKYGIDNKLLDHICRILTAYWNGCAVNSLEFKIVSDACRIAQLRQQTDNADEIKSWKTPTAQRLAEEILDSSEKRVTETDKET